MPSLFLHPVFLIALAALTLPWIIEWLFRRRKRQVELPTIRFLLDNPEQKKVRRQDLVLLLLRTAAIVLLVLAVARPLLRQSWVGGQRERQVIILLDATASMQQQVDVSTAFGVAQKKAAGVVRALPAGSKVTVATLTDRAQAVVENESDLLTAAAKIEGLRPTVGSAPMSAALRWVKEFLAAGPGEAELYIFSDFQAFTWQRGGQSGDVGQAFADLGNSCETFLVDVGGHSSFNYLVTMLRPEEFVLSAGKPVKFLAEVQSRGHPPADARAAVTFLVDGAKTAVREVSMSDRPAPLEFEYRFPKAGEYLLEVLVEGDDYLLDNRRRYLCRVVDDLRILILDDSADGPSVETSYLARSIRPPSHPGVDKLSHFDVKAVLPARIAFENLASYAVVVLAGTAQLNESMAGQLERYVADGGALWLFLNDSVNSYDYNKHLFKGGKGLLPGQLLEKESIDADAKSGPVYPRYGETAHPALSQFARLAGNSDAAFLRWMRMAPAPGATLVLPLSNGVPALIEKQFGRGKALLANMTPGLGWSVLPVLPEFPVLVQELLRYLVGDPDAAVNLMVGDRFDQPVLMSNQHLLLRYPDGGKQRLTPRKQPGNEEAYRLVFDQTTQQGLYQIEAIEEVLARRRFVVNMNPEESELTRLTKSEFQDAFPAGNTTWMAPETSVEELAARLHTVTELFPWLIGALALALAVESLLAWRFGRRRSGGLAA
jgi:hypothetical protein